MNNKLFFDYGPVWSNKCFDKELYLASRNVPLPDSITCGKMVTQDFFSQNETSDNSENESVKLQEPKVKTRKHTTKKFPLNFDTCAIPLLNQQYYERHLPVNVDKRYLNIQSSYELNNVNHLVYGECDEESFVLKISTLNELDDENNCQIVLGNSQSISDYNVLHQVEANVIDGIPYILLIVDDTVSFLKVTEEGFNLCCIESNDTTSSCLNKDFNNCFAFTSKGTVNLFDVNKENVSWSCHLTNSTSKKKKYTQCEFSSSPFNICVSCKSDIIMADTRIAENNQRKLFNIKEFDSYLLSNEEFISSFKHTQDFPLFYVACSDTLLLMDERYCKYPILNWHHMIKGRPSYIQNFKSNDIDFVLMADSNKSQICFTSTKSDNSEYPDVVSLSSPIHKNIVKDTVLFAKQNEIAFTDLTERQICSPLVGLSILPFSFGHTIVYQNSYGNLFYFNCYDRKSKHIRNKETAIKPLKTFEKFVQKKLRKNHLKKCSKGKYVDGFNYKKCYLFLEKTIKKGEDWNKFIWDISSIKNFCTYSKFYSKNEIKKKDESNPSCFADKDRDSLSAEYIKNCSDSFSQKILSCWSSDFSDFSSLDAPLYKSNSSDLFQYRSCPYFLDNEDAYYVPLLGVERKQESKTSTNNDDDISNDLENFENVSDSSIDKNGKESSSNTKKRKKSIIAGF